MNSLNFLRIACVALLGIGLCACPPVTSKTPVGTTVKAVRDPALAGVWRGKVADGDAVSYFTFLPQDDGTYSVVLVTPPSAKDNGGFGVFGVQTVTFGPPALHQRPRDSSDDNKPAKGTMADNTIPLTRRLSANDEPDSHGSDGARRGSPGRRRARAQRLYRQLRRLSSSGNHARDGKSRAAG